MSNTLRASLNVFWLLSVLTVNTLSNTLPLNGLTQKELSDLYPIPLTPSPYVFSIWGLIYLGILTYVVIQALPSRRNDPRIRQLDLPFALSSVFNIGWIFAWHYRFVGLSVILMIGILGSLLLAYLRLDSTRRQSEGVNRWVMDSTFSMYLAWISLATMINISAWLYSLSWQGGPLSANGWTVVLLFVALCLFLTIGLTRRDTALLGVLTWASFGIQVKNSSIPLIATAAWIVFGVSLLAALWSFWANRSSHSSALQTTT